MDVITSSSDVLASRILRKASVRREPFDPKNAEHLESFKRFLETGNWGTIQFFAEFPFVTVPETVMRRFCAHQLNASCPQL